MEEIQGPILERYSILNQELMSQQDTLLAQVGIMDAFKKELDANLKVISSRTVCLPYGFYGKNGF